MPQILVVTDTGERPGGTVVYSERVLSSDLESDHFSGQLVERVGWAVRDAEVEGRIEARPAGASRSQPTRQR